MIGVSAYLPLIDTLQLVESQQIFSLWQQTVKRALDNFAIEPREPIFISEIGYRNSADALYHTWEATNSAPPNQVTQAGALHMALANVIPDLHIPVTFFWEWTMREHLISMACKQ